MYDSLIKSWFEDLNSRVTSVTKDGVVKLNMAGTDRAAIQMEFSDGVLDIKGGSYHYAVGIDECMYDVAKTEATYTNGMLTLSVPKLKSKQPITVSIKD